MCRQGSSDEVALLIAEFGLLDQQLATLATAVEQSQAILITEDELIPVASEIPDMLTRLGIAYAPSAVLCTIDWRVLCSFCSALLSVGEKVYRNDAWMTCWTIEPSSTGMKCTFSFTDQL